MLWILNVLASIAYAVGGAFMKSSDAFRQAGASVAVFACFGVAATAQTFAMKHQDLGVGYVLVLGLEAIAAVLLGAVVFREPVTVMRVWGIALVLGGMFCLKK